MRLHLVCALITAALLFWTLRPSELHRFTFQEVQNSAERLSHEPFVPLSRVLPPALKKLPPEQSSKIFWKDAYRLWRQKGLPFQVDFYHPDNSFPTCPEIRVVDQHGAHLLGFSPSFFNYTGSNFYPDEHAKLGYAGFYVRYPINKSNSLDGFFSVLGSNYFRALAKDQTYGLSARGISINTGLTNPPEEFPEFKQWWLHQPDANAQDVVLDALLDGPSVTGAYGFKIHPGAVTSIDVHATLFFRREVKQLGLTPFSSMYLYGENAANHFGNFHPEIHDSDGLLINSSHNDWIWRPLQQTLFLQRYEFADENPRGFGLLQRDRDFQHYQDLDLQYNVRPSVWVTPKGHWGKGQVVLTQLASNNPNTDNVVLFWKPDQSPKAGDRLDLDYTVSFYMNDAQRPPLAYSKATFIVNPAPPAKPPAPAPAPVAAATGSKPGAGATPPAHGPVSTSAQPAVSAPPSSPAIVPDKDTVPVQFMIDFAGNGIENLAPDAPPAVSLKVTPEGTPIRDVAIAKIGYENSWRATFVITPLKHFVPTEIHCRLMQNDRADSRPLSEQWTYTWHQ